MWVVPTQAPGVQDRHVKGEQSQSPASPQGSVPDKKIGLRLFELLITVPTIAVIAILFAQDPSGDAWLILWAVTIAAVEILPVPAWHGLQVSVGFPLLMVVAFVYAPPAAAITAFAGASDPREFKGEVSLLRAMFNRSQVALSVLAASAVFHALADLEESPTWVLVPAALLAAVVDYVINSGIVTAAVCLNTGLPPLRVIRDLRVGRLSEFLVSYLGLAFFGLFLAKFYEELGFWTVPVFVIPLLLARQMFFRSKALEEAHKELQDREQLLRALSNRMAEERQDERLQIAAFLHDDLAQHLFRLSIQVDVARRHLAAGKLEETGLSLEEIKETKNRTSDRIRALIRDLHRSPLGRAGLAEALHSFIAETARDSHVRVHTDIDELPLPPPIALLLYHIAREGVMNALRHADAKNVWVTVKPIDDEVMLELRDDGVGFDTSAPAPEGHFGLTMMRERALVAGGTIEVLSAVGEGTKITVQIPTSWLASEGAALAPATPLSPPAGASPGTAPATTGPSAESVLA
jgi:signal transduction histidine kinase